MDEIRIISDDSPVLSGQYTTRTEELSLFKLLLTGVDDSSVIATESSKESKARQKAQLELLDRLIPELETEIQKLDKEPTSIEERRKRTDEAIAARTRGSYGQSTGNCRSTRRRGARLGRRRNNSDADKPAPRNSVAASRFLEEHYNNDLARLQAIIEMDSYFSQLRQVRCPLCGASTDQHDPSIHDGQPRINLENIRHACRAEIA